jgi:chromosome segregation ATPase
LLGDGKTLANTLCETQGELENLVNDHEQITNELTGARELLITLQSKPQSLKQEAQGLTGQLQQKNEEVETLQ